MFWINFYKLTVIGSLSTKLLITPNLALPSTWHSLLFDVLHQKFDYKQWHTLLTLI